ncbi:ORF4 [Alphabaculovirus altermyunipunctae]|uniref:ORF4 n=1 Tax=Mythimna unipuncta nucleopolyhedrovirus TaxID=447897 RepID=A0A346TPE1_9ABAC|nr:ORF4 [Mythimna unipuncta nucleopolyhedrovirus]AXU41451.1 ORF4 [Mythimna unipuncta nucleopolyhedrovirus]
MSQLKTQFDNFNIVKRCVYANWLQYRTYCLVKKFNNYETSLLIDGPSFPNFKSSLEPTIADLEREYNALLDDDLDFEAVEDKIKKEAGYDVKDFIKNKTVTKTAVNKFMHLLLEAYVDKKETRKTVYKFYKEGDWFQFDSNEKLRYLEALMYYFHYRGATKEVEFQFMKNVKYELYRLNLLRKKINK